MDSELTKSMITLLVGWLLIVPPFWKISAKAGFDGKWSLLVCVPVSGLIAIWVVAYSDWDTDSKATLKHDWQSKIDKAD